METTIVIRLKSKKQLTKVRASCSLLSSLLKELALRVRPGVSTGELDAFSERFIAQGGGKSAFLGYNGFPANLCISVNEEVIHGIPGKRILREGDIVGIDCGIELEGFFSDAAYTFAVGEISPEVARLVRVTRECLERVMERMKPGDRIHELGRIVYGHAMANGYGVVKEYCGHGLGFALHEDPQIPNYVSSGPNPRLVPGMVFAVEPMINMGTGEIHLLDDDWTVVTLDGRPSAHFEHTFAVLEDRIEALTTWPA